MKNLIAALCFSLSLVSACSQGLVKFANNASTLVSVMPDLPPWVSGPLPSGAAASYLFGLLIAPSGTTDPGAFTFTGTYATNTAAAGRST